MRTLETMMEERSWPSRRRWKARVGYDEGFWETRSLGSSIRGNMMGWRCEGLLCLWRRQQQDYISMRKRRMSEVMKSLSRTASLAEPSPRGS